MGRDTRFGMVLTTLQFPAVPDCWWVVPHRCLGKGSARGQWVQVVTALVFSSNMDGADMGMMPRLRAMLRRPCLGSGGV